MGKKYAPVAVAFAASLLIGCGPPPDIESPLTRRVAASIDPADMTEHQRAQRDVAIAAKDDLFGRLSGKLVEAMAAGGPAAAITVCKGEAEKITAEVGQQHGIEIGRTSHRLRNPDNTVPTWAAPFANKQVPDPQFLATVDGRLGVLLPIRLKAVCVNCHGPKDMLPPAVADTLRAEYPLDQATGFREGDLRGWFWMVVPAQLPPSTAEESAASS